MQPATEHQGLCYVNFMKQVSTVPQGKYESTFIILKIIIIEKEKNNDLILNIEISI